MDLLFKYSQTKESKLNAKYKCNLKLKKNQNFLHYSAHFEFTYFRHYSDKKKSSVKFENDLYLNLENGDIRTLYSIDTNKNEKSVKKTYEKINNFKSIHYFTESGHEKGEKRRGFWGAKYNATKKIIEEIIIDTIKSKFESEFLLKNTKENELTHNLLFQILTNYHLDRKKIKPHDNICYHIQFLYPSKKFLKRNDNKYLPAVLDSLDIKSKYLIKELSDNKLPIDILSLNYLCKLFGKNYPQYLRQFNWKEHCIQSSVKTKKGIELKNESEKKCLISVLKKWDWIEEYEPNTIDRIKELVVLREKLISHGVNNLKFQVNNNNDFNILFTEWELMNQYFSKKYKLRYVLPTEVINDIQEPIIIDDNKFEPTLLLTEEQFKIEGVVMKNCMGNQFALASIYLFLTLKNGNKRINLQYSIGDLKQAYGKANSEIPPQFNNAIEILTSRISRHKGLKWYKEKYEIIN